MIESICIVSDGYATPTDPYYSFVEQLAVAMAERGVKITVISPQSITKHWLRGKELHPKYRHYNNEDGLPGIEVFQPYVFSLGNRFDALNEHFIKLAIKKTFRNLKERPQICYGHFWHSALRLYPIAKKYNIPLFVACGESNVSMENHFTADSVIDFINYVSGVVCVSSKNRDESVEAGFATAEKCIVIPNAIDDKVFRLKNKNELRDKYGISRNDFIVAFVGAFEHRKGTKRLSNAIKTLNNPNIKSFFIGKGLDFVLEEPDCEGIIHKGPIKHDILPDYLNMADVFCLPTLNEGCCNAIVEALACGLPVVSSDKSFNYDILNEKNAILIDPMNEKEIAGAINKLYNEEDLRKRLSQGAVEEAKMLTIQSRAEKILNYIEGKNN